MSLLRFTQPLIACNELQSGRPVTVTVGEEQLVVLRQGERFFAYPPRCPHRGTSLAHARPTGVPGELQCAYHGWRLAADGAVEDARGTALPHCGFQPRELQAHFGYVWLMADTPVPIGPGPGMRFCGSEGYVLSAPFHVVLDNFNEGTHTPFVHGVTGPTPDQWDAVSFDWSDQPDHVAIHYQGPQRKHLVFHGRKLVWDIAWRTYFAPVHMVYESAWFPPGRPEAPQLRLRHAYFIAPLGAERTRFHAFTFAAFDAYPRALHGLLGLVARRLTRNQILEDERFYPLIRDLPRSFHGLHLERYDQPVFRIRTRADAEYFAT